MFNNIIIIINNRLNLSLLNSSILIALTRISPCMLNTKSSKSVCPLLRNTIREKIYKCKNELQKLY